ncbi:hypothetical protein BC938DRAFT_475427 [Jimgerdemannia flammicorona]|uniref:EamA domain-containing protein n=1 Tax=Jimgerdemannia flammicorona TaxID=994334 RepID=A0A433QRM4_9FUNG|nr:hypothetical protein BC938DRAFT_475427 [Jimgerdemannia flammicorona]
MPEHNNTQRKRYLVGVLALLSVVLIWVASSFLMNNIFSSQNFNKPFLVTYVNTASFSLYLIPFLLFRRDDPARRRVADQEEYARLHDVADVGVCAIIPSNLFICNKRESTGVDALNSEPLNIREIAKLSMTFCILWFLANWSTNASLAYTTVASSTILASMSGFFTLAIGAMAGIERFNWIKFGAVCLSVLGVILVSTSDNQSTPSLPLTHTNAVFNATADDAPTNKLFGDFLALIGALFYGCYTVLLKLRIRNEERVSMPLFFGFVGAFNVCLLWPAFFILHFTGIEPFDLPSTAMVWGMVVVNALVGTFLSDYLWLLSMLMTSPLVVTLGLSLTIPLALTGDILFKLLFVGPQYWCGALLVIAGFVAVNSAAWGEVKQQEEENPLEEQHHVHVASMLIPKNAGTATTDSGSVRSSVSYGSMDGPESGLVMR